MIQYSNAKSSPFEIKADYCSNTKLKTFIGNTAVIHLTTVQKTTFHMVGKEGQFDVVKSIQAFQY